MIVSPILIPIDYSYRNLKPWAEEKNVHLNGNSKCLDFWVAQNDNDQTFHLTSAQKPNWWWTWIEILTKVKETWCKLLNRWKSCNDHYRFWTAEHLSSFKSCLRISTGFDIQMLNLSELSVKKHVILRELEYDTLKQ